MTIWAIESCFPQEGGWQVINTFVTREEAQAKLAWMNRQWPDTQRRLGEYQRIEDTSTSTQPEK